MKVSRVGEKAARLLGDGMLYQQTGGVQWRWQRDEDGRVIALGMTLSEAWRKLDALQEEENLPDKGS